MSEQQQYTVAPGATCNIDNPVNDGIKEAVVFVSDSWDINHPDPDGDVFVRTVNSGPYREQGYVNVRFLTPFTPTIEFDDVQPGDTIRTTTNHDGVHDVRTGVAHYTGGMWIETADGGSLAYRQNDNTIELLDRPKPGKTLPTEVGAVIKDVQIEDMGYLQDYSVRVSEGDGINAWYTPGYGIHPSGEIKDWSDGD